MDLQIRVGSFSEFEVFGLQLGRGLVSLNPAKAVWLTIFLAFYSLHLASYSSLFSNIVKEKPLASLLQIWTSH